MNCNAKLFIPSIKKSIQNYHESWDTLPFDMFMEYIIKLLDFKDVCRLSMVSKSFHDYYSTPLIWKHFYIQQSVKNYYPKKLNSIMEKCISKNLNRPNRDKNRIPLVIENNSDIPYNIYWIKQEPKFVNDYNIDIEIVSEYKKMGQINPGKVQKILSCENHHWICIPTIEWLSENPYYNVGFGFHININYLEDYEHIKKNNNNTTSENKLTYVKRIHQPKNLQLCLFCYKNSNIENYKHMFMECLINKRDFNVRINNIKDYNKSLKKNIKNYTNEIIKNENKINKNIQISTLLEYALSVCKSFICM